MMFNNLNLDPNINPSMMNMNIMMNNMSMNQKDSTLKRLKWEYELCSNGKDLAESIGTSFGLIDEIIINGEQQLLVQRIHLMKMDYFWLK